MANSDTFKAMLKSRRLKMGAGNRAKTKSPKSVGQWLYPHAREKAYAKDITKMQRLILDPLVLGIRDNLDSWIDEYKTDSIVPIDKIGHVSYSDTAETDAKWLQDTLEKKPTTVKQDTIKLDAFSDELQTLLEEAQQRMVELYGVNAPQVRALITAYGEDISLWNQTQYDKFTKALLGVEFVVTEPWELEVIQQWTNTNFELIKSLSTEGIKAVNTIVSDGVNFGKTYNAIMKEIRAKYDNITVSRANLIARDQVGKLNGVLTKRRMEDAGIDMYTWQTARDEKVRSKHKTLEGKLCRWDNSDVYSKDGGKTWIPRTSDMFHGIPGQDIQCFLGDTKVFSPVLAQKLYRRWYTGKATTFTLNDGSTFTCTLNHPILTSSGKMVPAHMINVGQDIVSISPNGRFPLLEGNQEDTIATFKELFDLGSIIGFKSTTSTVGSDFHGDGIINEKVDIISLEDELPINCKTLIEKKAIKKFLTKADMQLSFMLADSRIMAMLHSLGFTSNRFISLFGKLLTLRHTILTEPSDISLRAITKLNTVLRESSGNSTTINTILFGQKEKTFTSEVLSNDLFYRNLFTIMRNYFMMDNSKSHLSEFFRKIIGLDTKGLAKFTQSSTSDVPTMHIVEKRISKLSVHVYNLQNCNSWYSITHNRLIVNNCRCGAIPFFDDMIQEVDNEINKETV